MIFASDANVGGDAVPRYQDPSPQVPGVWVDAYAFYTGLGATLLHDHMFAYLTAHGWKVQQILVPPGPAFLGTTVRAKLDIADAGPVDVASAYDAIEASLGRWAGISTAFADTLDELGDQVVDPTVDDLKDAAKWGGAGAGVVLIVVGVLYLLAVTGELGPAARGNA
jgi:hypothetical protein